MISGGAGKAEMAWRAPRWVVATMLVAPLWLAGMLAAAEPSDVWRETSSVDVLSGVTVYGRLQLEDRELVITLVPRPGVRLNARYGVLVSALPESNVDWSGRLPFELHEDREYFDDPVSVRMSYEDTGGAEPQVAVNVQYGWCDTVDGICVPAEAALRF